MVIGEAEWTEAETFCATLVKNETVATLASSTSKSDADIIGTALYSTIAIIGVLRGEHGPTGLG